MRQLKEISSIISEHGGKLYVVGGSVRDEILGYEIKDVDCVLVGMEFYTFKNLFPEAKETGKSFPVFRLNTKDCNEIEIAFARIERKTAFGHNGFIIDFQKTITLNEDLFRRDFTMNTIVKDIETDQIIDYFNGTQDIKDKIIRAVSSHFLEDPLRALRAARFAAKYQFKIDNSTMLLINRCKNELKYLSIERIIDELQKALATKHTNLFFKVLKDADILDIFPYVSYNDDLMKKLDGLNTDISTKFAIILCYSNIQDIIDNNLLNNYPNMLKDMVRVAKECQFIYNSKNVTVDYIIKLMKTIHRSHLDINQWDKVISTFYKPISFINERVYQTIELLKISLPNNLRNTNEIKEYVYNKKLEALKKIRKEMRF